MDASLAVIPPPPVGSGPLRFRFDECLGTGSFGEVYRATVRRPGEEEREVAVKVLRLERRDQPEAVSRLNDEARMLAVLDHPAILRFHELCRVEGRIALVTEFVDGFDLDRFVRSEETMPVRVALEVLAEVASALQSALNRPSPETGNPLGLVHRDLKPHNIRISSRGEVKLLDFGIARTTELARDARTMAGDVVCTPGYASPEVLCGDAPGPEADVYGLGVTLYHLLVDAPFHPEPDVAKQRWQVLLAKRYRSFIAERLALLPVLPPELAALIESMLAHEPEERPSASRVEASLRAIAADLQGPSLVEWVSTLRLDAHPAREGELAGRVLFEESFSAVPTATPAQASLRPPMQVDPVVPERASPPAAKQESSDAPLVAAMTVAALGACALIGWLLLG